MFLPLTAPCSRGMAPASFICCIILLAKMTLSHQLKSASRRHIALSLSIFAVPATFSSRTVTPCPHLVSGVPLVVAMLMLLTCSETSRLSEQMAL